MQRAPTGTQGGQAKSRKIAGKDGKLRNCGEIAGGGGSRPQPPGTTPHTTASRHLKKKNTACGVCVVVLTFVDCCPLDKEWVMGPARGGVQPSLGCHFTRCHQMGPVSQSLTAHYPPSPTATRRWFLHAAPCTAPCPGTTWRRASRAERNTLSACYIPHMSSTLILWWYAWLWCAVASP